MREQLLYKLSYLLWSAITLTIVGLALYVSMGRFLMGNVAPFQQDILRELNARLNFVIEADRLSGRWESLTPYLELEGVRVLGDLPEEPGVSISSVKLGLDMLSSLRSLGPQLYALELGEVTLLGDIDRDGKFSIPGIPASDGVLLDRVLDFVLNTERLTLDRFSLLLRRYSDKQEQQIEEQVFSELQLLRDGNFRRLNASAFNPEERSWIRIMGEATGDPRRSNALNADLHMQVSITDAESYTDLARLAGFSLQCGELRGQFWLSSRRGVLRTAADFVATDLALTQLNEGAEQIVFDALSARFRADRRRDVWSFGASEIEAKGSTESFELAGISGELEEGVLTLQVANIDVESLVDYALEEKLLPAGAGDLFEVLSPSGHFTRLQTTVTDLNDMANSWQLQANFEDLAVESWKGAPKIRNGTGYLSMSRDRGLIQIDTQDFSMGYPTVYKHDLTYRAFQAELAFKLEEDRFDLWSGHFKGNAEEGEVHGLFALTVPIGESLAGLEMDLLVGIEDAHPRHRNKYLPYTLPEGLLNWLEQSIGDGHLDEAGFIFRGSLKRGGGAYRSIQAYSQVARAELDYHPDWPALSDVYATLFVDNTHVDVFAQRAKVYASQVENAEVRLRPNPEKELILSLRGELEGRAQDGLDLVNNSPLKQLVGDAFAQWTLDGSLSANLALELNLTDLEAEQGVQLDARLNQVDLLTGELNLPVTDIAGEFSYRTDTGFDGEQIVGRLWGEPLTASLRQGRGEQGLNDLDVQVNGRVASAAVRDWLQVDMLRLAEGSAEAELHIIVPPGETARIELTTDLQGVALDLPEQFAKPAEQATSLRLGMPIAADIQDITLQLEDRAWLNLLIDDRGLSAAGLGFGKLVAADSDQRLVVGGHLDRLSWDPWMAFVDEYVITGEADSPEAESGDFAMLVVARDLYVEELALLGQTLNEVEIDARQLSSAWEVDLGTSWVRGSFAFPEELTTMSVDIDYLDLDRLPDSLMASLQGENEADDEGFVEWLRLTVDAEGIQQGGSELGEVEFEFAQDGEVYHFTNIKGDFRGMLLGGDEPMHLRWDRSPGRVNTRLVGPLRFVDFGEVLEGFGYERIIETNSGQFDVDAGWAGAPADFSIETLRGRLGVAVDQGAFLKTSAAAEGTLKVMGILNLAEFVRRLSFDMNYLFKSGIHFDSITGELLMEDGLVDVPRMDVLGASSRFQFVGLVDTNTASIDGELVATLPVASNLPWIAALIGGLPAAAGVYVVSKVFTKQVDRFSSGVYSINGPWVDPKVKFERIFDNTTSHQQVVAQRVGEEPDLPETPAESAAVTESEAASETTAEAN